MSSSSTWSVLKQETYRTHWIGFLVASVGSWTGDMAGNWLMASSTSSNFMIASINIASSLPLFLFAFIAGVLSDAFSRKTMLLLNGLGISIIAILMGIYIHTNVFSTYAILIYVFLMGTANAFFDPVWRGTIPLLVTEDSQTSAFAIDGVATNIARALGPILAGFIIAHYNVSFAFYFMGITYLIFSLIISTWKNAPIPTTTFNHQSFKTSIRTGFQFLLYSPPIQRIFLRGFLVIFPVSAMWSMWPIIGKHKLALSSTDYGIVVSFVGMGAIVAATFAKQLREKFGLEKIFMFCSLMLIVNILTMALSPYWYLLCITMFFAGFSWLILLASVQSNILPFSPTWVRSRVIALYSLLFFGSITLGSFLWGLLAEFTNVEFTLYACAFIFLIFLVIAYFNPLPTLQNANEESLSLIDVKSSFSTSFKTGVDGPILISIDYRIEENKKAEFLLKIEDLGIIRKKNGAYMWTILQDLEHPLIQKEQFMVSSKEEYEQQEARMTTYDKEIYSQIIEMTAEKTPPSHRYFKTQELI